MPLGDPRIPGSAHRRPRGHHRQPRGDQPLGLCPLPVPSGIFHYLRLCLWPSPLVADYGADFVTFRDALPWAVLLAALLALVAWAVVKRPAFGFLGAWFFVILAPTSSFVGGTRQMLAEHRMYLPLAAVVVGAVLLLHRWLGHAGAGGLPGDRGDTGRCNGRPKRGLSRGLSCTATRCCIVPGTPGRETTTDCIWTGAGSRRRRLPNFWRPLSSGQITRRRI